MEGLKLCKNKFDLKIAVLVSGSGSNLQAIIDQVKNGGLNLEIGVVIADRKCFALERAESEGITTKLLDRKSERFYEDLMEILSDEFDLIVLAGFLSILPSFICRRFEKRIINIHPSLLPKYGGIGMYGIKVHEAVLQSGEKYTGASVHFVSEGVDEGKVLLQRSIKIPNGITAKELQKYVLENVEHKLIVEVLETYC